MTDLEHAYLVLGDKRGTVDNHGGPRLDRGVFVVRMFVGDKTFDEELETSLDGLDGVVQARMKALAKKPDRKLQVEAERPRIDPGHAVILP